MARATSPAVDPNGSPITLMACLIACVIFAICSSGVIECLLSVACRLSLICHRVGRDQHGWTGGTSFYGCPSIDVILSSPRRRLGRVLARKPQEGIPD